MVEIWRSTQRVVRNESINCIQNWVSSQCGSSPLVAWCWSSFFAQFGFSLLEMKVLICHFTISYNASSVGSNANTYLKRFDFSVNYSLRRSSTWSDTKLAWDQYVLQFQFHTSLGTVVGYECTTWNGARSDVKVRLVWIAHFRWWWWRIHHLHCCSAPHGLTRHFFHFLEWSINRFLLKLFQLEWSVVFSDDNLLELSSNELGGICFSRLVVSGLRDGCVCEWTAYTLSSK